ncbi:MAG: hypothetical protein IT174_07300 [Acidobacteria bacterium]|nr:hypothetical protein [Acidobacteriota bacterium]
MRSLILFTAAALCVGCQPASNTNIAANTGPTVAGTASPSPSPARKPVNTMIGDPTPPTSPLPPDAKGVQAAIDVVHEYYAAINAKDFRKAYELWSGKGDASHQTFEEFRDGFANTASVRVDTSGEPGPIEGAAGSRYVAIPALIYAKTNDGKDQKFWGEYVLRRSVVDGSTEDQRAWRIYSATIKEQ